MEINNICEKCGKEMSRRSKNCASCNMRLIRYQEKIAENGTRTNMGYIRVHKSLADPKFHSMVNSQNHIMQHRLVMAQHLDRALLRTEIVHHINGTKDDNRIENLVLLKDSEDHTIITILDSRVRILEEEMKKLNFVFAVLVSESSFAADLTEEKSRWN